MNGAGMDRSEGFRFIDLFAGIGGLRRPFEEIGGRCVFTSEWDRYCRGNLYCKFSGTRRQRSRICWRHSSILGGS